MYMRVCEEWVCGWGEEGEGGEGEEQNTSLNASRDVIGVHIITLYSTHITLAEVQDSGLLFLAFADLLLNILRNMHIGLLGITRDY